MIEVVDCIGRNLGRVPGLYSLILYGSLVRGDYLPGTSDVDFFAVLEDGIEPEEVLSRIRPVLEECTKPLKPVEVDIAWEWLSNLRDPLRLGYPYKFLTVYQADFRENHIVVTGEDIVELLPEYRVKEILPGRLEGILKNLERFSGNPKMLHILAGETARLMAFLHGSSLKKDDVLRKLEEIGDEEAVEIYHSYLAGRKMEFNGEFLREFIVSRVRELKGLQDNLR
ncbi:nucleotidyltransferase domain-containing protein [Thermococcus pacificus]|uniref:Nucleotidyltransferase n=1 Tax=Thermococcus pacificus TaxID=71998 RepID=A0A218P5A5_9EURY|nr:nucleotidyltransferase domain-containing protein [Thermococcus pacificus]ASJ05957.1 nucleotidyltransferase [Thermococcus pacificus]